MAYTEIVITKFGDHLVSMLLKDGHPVEFQGSFGRFFEDGGSVRL